MVARAVRYLEHHVCLPETDCPLCDRGVTHFPRSCLNNRDIWRDEALQEIIMSNFTFWQKLVESEDGKVFAQRYQVTAFPFIGIIDPRTGSLIWQNTPRKALTLEIVIEKLMDFTSTNPAPGCNDAGLSKQILKASASVGDHASSSSSSSSLVTAKSKKQREIISIDSDDQEYEYHDDDDDDDDGNTARAVKAEPKREGFNASSGGDSISATTAATVSEPSLSHPTSPNLPGFYSHQVSWMTRPLHECT
jgi:hypothetical protein